MTRYVVWAAVLLVPYLVTGCSGGADDPVKRKVRVLEQAAGVLENVNSETAAPAAKPDLKRLGDQLKELDTEIAALPTDKRAELEKKHKKDLDEAMMRIKNKEMRMRAIKGGGDAYDQLGIK